MKQFFTLLGLLVTTALFSQEHACALMKQKAMNALVHHSHKDLSEYANYDVKYVKLDLNVDNLSTDISGVMTMEAEVTATIMNRLVLELHEDLAVYSATVNGAAASSIDREDTELIIGFPVIMDEGDMVTITVDYGGTPPTGNGFNSESGIFNDFSPSWGAQVTWTLSQPFGAFTWWPCKQDLNDKIDRVEMHLTVPDNLKAGSNGVLMNEVVLPNNEIRFEWETNYPIDFYLISLAVGPYIEYSYKVKPVTSPDSILIQNYIYDNPGTLPNFIDDIDETGDMMIFFSNIYGNYPFWEEKYGHCMAPLSGGMEHQTMTTQGFFVRWLTAHEIGHQWFGDNVTCNDWSHIWVNEGFASYSEYLYQESVDYNVAQADFADVHNFVMSQPGGSTFVEDPTDVGEIFSSRLTYDKGAVLCHMIRHWMGDGLFFESLRIFQNNFKESTASAEDFQNVIEGLTNVDFQNFFDHWYYGEGFPIVSAEWNDSPEGFVVQLDQESSVPNITPFHECFVDVQLNFDDGSDTILHLFNSLNGQHYIRDIEGTVVSLEIDPENWLLNAVGTIEKNTDLTFDSLASGINELSFEVSLLPNPVIDVLLISTEGNEDVSVDIFDAQGKFLVAGLVVQGELELSTSAWSSGVYFVRISDGVGVETRKVVK